MYTPRVSRLTIVKTIKLFIDGKFPRSESGRSLPLLDPEGNVAAHAAHASRKDLKAAVEAARKAQPGWQNASAMLRGQILYRLAEMMEGKRSELADALRLSRPNAAPCPDPDREVPASIDRVVHYAGWADKYAQVLGCGNAVASPHYNFTSPEPTGVVCAVCPDAPALLGLVTLALPVLCSGNALIVLASQANPAPALVLAEAWATCDLPGGVLNTLAAPRAELLSWIAGHRGIDAVVAANLTPAEDAALLAGAAENLKRVRARRVADFYDANECQSVWWIEPTVEFKTVWHPSAL